MARETPESSDSEATPTEAEPPSRAESRRERQRQNTITEIKAAAREQLVVTSGSELSLRAVAREVGLTPSAMYRYFSSRQALVAAVATDCYQSAAEAVTDACDEVGEQSCYVQTLAMGHAYRRWVLENPAEFGLIFTTDQSDLLDGPGLMTRQALHAFYAAPLGVFVNGIEAGEVDLARARFRHSPILTEPIETLRQHNGERIDAHAVGVLLTGWAELHGYVSLEVFGQFSWFMSDLDAVFDHHLRAITTTMGWIDSAG